MGVVEELPAAAEPASPSSCLMQQPVFNLYILAVLGFKSTIDVHLFKSYLSQTLLHHPRFSSLLVKKGKRGGFLWKQVGAEVDDHVIAPDLDENMECGDQFVEDFTVGLSKTPLDATKPLWEVYILNVKTSDADSSVIFKIHHSVGDGVSLISLVLSCSKKLSDPQSLPVAPVQNHGLKHGLVSGSSSGPVGLLKRFLVLIPVLFLVAFYTLIDITLILVTILFLKDSETAIKGSAGAELSPKRFVHRIVSLDDVKLIKKAMNASINDVVLGVTEAGITRYLNSRYEKTRQNGVAKKEMNPKNSRMTMAVVFNLRPSPFIQDLADVMEKGKKLEGMWGNKVGMVLIPLKINLQKDPITYINKAKATMQRKKLSLGPKVIFIILKVIIRIFGIKAAAALTSRLFYNTTFGFSNVMGPQEEICLFGHRLAYIAPTVYGFPQALVIHYQSYCDKLVIALAADEKLIPNPHQLCDDLQKSLENIKEAVIKRGLVISPQP